jgi:hypothetical protein
MQIEILTTKKKLSKSIVKQFELATVHDMEVFLSINGECAYYITDLGVKQPKRTGIFKNSIGKWVRFDTSKWKVSPHDSNRAYCRNRYRDFDCALDASNWVKTRNRMADMALKNHLIL